MTSVDCRCCPDAALLAAVAGCNAVLTVDQCRRSSGVTEGLMALFAEPGGVPVSRLTAEDSFIATGPAYAATLSSADSNFAAVCAILRREV